MTRETIRRWKWIGGGFILLITGILYYFTVRQKPEEIPEPIYETESSVIEISREEEQKVYVHVGGAVQHPDVVYILEHHSPMPELWPESLAHHKPDRHH